MKKKQNKQQQEIIKIFSNTFIQICMKIFFCFYKNIYKDSCKKIYKNIYDVYRNINLIATFKVDYI